MTGICDTITGPRPRPNKGRWLYTDYVKLKNILSCMVKKNKGNRP